MSYFFLLFKCVDVTLYYSHVEKKQEFIHLEEIVVLQKREREYGKGIVNMNQAIEWKLLKDNNGQV